MKRKIFCMLMMMLMVFGLSINVCAEEDTAIDVIEQGLYVVD